jgi:putative phage-type endonuclease
VSEVEVKEQRRKFIGGSDIAAVVGLSPWKTRTQLWADKITPAVDSGKKPKKQLSRGHRWEGVVAEMLVEKLSEDGHDVEVLTYNHRHIDVDLPHFACEIDFVISLNGRVTNVELKTVHPFAKNQWGAHEDDVPVHYQAQLQWGMGITGVKQGIIAPLFGADEIQAYLYDFEEDTCLELRKAADTFWREHVLTGIPPEPEELVDLKLLFPSESEGSIIQASEEIREALLRMRFVEREIDARNAEWDHLEFLVKRFMGDNEKLLVGSESKEAAVWKSRATSYLDQSKLKEDHPALVKQYTTKGTSRVFTLKGFSLDGVKL